MRRRARLKLPRDPALVPVVLSMSPDPRPVMTKLLAFAGATVGSYAGWALGAPAGLFTAFVVSMIGMGAGMYWGRRIGRHYEA